MKNRAFWCLFVLVLGVLVGCSGAEGPSTTFTPDLPNFTDVAKESGLDFQQSAFHWGLSGDPVAMMGGGICWIDYDNDGWLDLYAVNSYSLNEAGRWQTEEGGLPLSRMFQNKSGSFTDVSEQTGTGVAIRGNGCVAADLNMDGWTDLYITTDRYNLLFWNNGDGTFAEGGEAAGIDAYGWQTAAVVGDVNRDGWPDMFVAGYVDVNNPIPSSTMGFPNTHYGVRDLLYLSNGPDEDGLVTFREVGEVAGIESDNFEYGLGASFSDFDGDGDLDLLVANDTNPNRLYENIPWPGGVEGDPEGIGVRFAEVGTTARINDRNSGMGVASGDYNNDGNYDLVITNMGPQYHSVYVNESPGSQVLFANGTQRIGINDIGVGVTGWGISWADIDLDTDLDLMIANGGIPVMNPATDVQNLQLLANLTAQGVNGRFTDVSEQAGLTTDIPPLIGRGSAAADYDNDGDIDVVVNSIAGDIVLLRNNNTKGHWLCVELDGFYPGAVVTVTMNDGTVIERELHTGSSYLSSEDPRLFFGLGNDRQVRSMRVRWPDGVETTQTNVRGDRIVEVARPAGGPQTIADSSTPEDVLVDLMLKEGGASPMVLIPAESQELVDLGEMLFWDKELSGNRDISCATCHHPTAGLGDNLPVSIGTGGHGQNENRVLGEDREFIPRNSPELFNRGVVGWTTMFWDMRITGNDELDFISPAGPALPPDLENIMSVQAMFPVTSREELRGERGDRDLNGEINELARYGDDDLRGQWSGIMERLLAIPEYQDMFAAAYPDVPEQWLGFQHAARALATYEMTTFTFNDSPWDQYLLGDEDALSEEALRGMFLFYGKAQCSQCHNGPLLTDQHFHNIGVPQIGPGKEEDAPEDHGRERETGLPAHLYAFRTPPLRNVVMTGPWMHNGAYMTLEEAVRHHFDPIGYYENYDVNQLPPEFRDTYLPDVPVLDTLDPLILELPELTDEEFSDLMVFLTEGLTSPDAEDMCDLIPPRVPSGLPIDEAPPGFCGN